MNLKRIYLICVLKETYWAQLEEVISGPNSLSIWTNHLSTWDQKSCPTLGLPPLMVVESGPALVFILLLGGRGSVLLLEASSVVLLDLLSFPLALFVSSQTKSGFSCIK